MTSIGETLRRERLRRGLSLEQVATETKISQYQLSAMEADQFDRLPGGVFTRSFLRQYARALGIDEEELVASLKAQFEEPAEPVPLPEPALGRLRMPHAPPLEDVRDKLRSDSSFSAFVWLVVVVLACAGVYTLWQSRRTAAAGKTPVTHEAAQPAQPKAVRPTIPTTTPAAPPKPEFRAAEVSESGAITEPKPPAQTPPAQPASAPAGASAVRVSLASTEPVWVSIKSDGARVFSGTIEPQQPRQFEASAKMLLFVGNAGGLEVTLNGKRVEPFGKRGEIRLLELTPAGAHIVPRTPPTSEDSTEPDTGADRP